MKIAVSGYKGRIGKLLIAKGCVPLECDVTIPQEVERAIAQVKPDVIAHLASISDVDYCERPENQEEAIKVNYNGTRYIVDAAENQHCDIVLLSTDHVFGGKHGPYKEDTPHHKTYLFEKIDVLDAPVNFYGRSKLAAESIQIAFDNMKIVRTSYLFDKERLNTLYNADFLYRSFMYVNHFVNSFYEYLLRFYEMPRILHISGSDTVSWFKFSKAVGMRNLGPRREDIEGFAPRPHKAGLNVDLSKKLGLPQYSYLDGLKNV